MDKGTVSNIVSLALVALGLGLRYVPTPAEVQELILDIGLFAFSGGATNSIAVKMLFDRVPGFYGSGVIQLRFQEIRAEIKRLILENFFDEAQLRAFLDQNAKTVDWRRYVDPAAAGRAVESFVASRWDRFASPEKLQALVSKQVEKLLDSNFGAFRHMLGKSTIDNIVAGFVGSIAKELRGQVLAAAKDVAGEQLLPDIQLDMAAAAHDLRLQVDKLIERKLLELTPLEVKRIVEDMIREHLGWLVVWGNVLGGILGAVANLLPYALR